MDSETHKTIAALLEGQRLGVLASSLDGHPYTTLVAFVASADRRRLYFATHRATRKFANIARDARVSLLIDNRNNRAEDFREAAAVTALGTASEVSAAERSSLLDRYLLRHPFLREFVSSPACALFEVRVRRYCLVRRFQDVSELDLAP